MLLTKHNVAILVSLAAVILLSGFGDIVPPAAGQTATPTPSDKKTQANVKWEYKALTDADIEKLAPEESKDSLTDGLNKLGDGGWELVTVVLGGPGGALKVNVGGPGPGGLPGGPGGGMKAPHLTYVFKRPK
jgi:hypothetical protein